MRAHTQQRMPAQVPRPSYDTEHPRHRLTPAAQGVAGAVALAALVASVLGLNVDGLYGGDEATAQMLRGYDAVTLAAAGVLGWGLRSWRRGALMGRLTSASMLAYLVYTYAYFLFGTGFNDAMLLHVVVFAGALVGLVLTLSTIDLREVSATFADCTHVRPAAIVLGVLASSLAAMWLYASMAYAVSGDMPAGSSLVESDTVVHLGIVLDLALLVPAYAAAAVLLWRRAAWGFVLATVMLLSGVLHQLGYVSALLFQWAADVPEAVAVDPVEPVIIALYAAATASLLVPARRTRVQRSRPPR